MTNSAARQGFDQAIDDAIRIISDWTREDTLRLRGGEMTAQEVRTVKAVLQAIMREINRL